MRALKVIIVGAGGHAAVAADALLAAGVNVVGFTDPEAAKHGRRLCNLPVLGGDEALSQRAGDGIALVNGIGGIGDTTLRRTVQERLESLGWKFLGFRHPSAVVSPFASVAADAQLCAGSVVQPGAAISKGCIVNTAAVIEHDVRLGAWSHVAPNALVCGNAVLGEGCHVGAGSVVLQGLNLGQRTVVGAGATVVRDFAGDGTLVGLPARLLERR